MGFIRCFVFLFFYFCFFGWILFFRIVERRGKGFVFFIVEVIRRDWKEERSSFTFFWIGSVKVLRERRSEIWIVYF